MINSTSPRPLNPDRIASRPASTDPIVQAQYTPPPKPPFRDRDRITAVAGVQFDPQSAPQSRTRPQPQPAEGFNPPPNPPDEPLGERSTVRKQMKESRSSEGRTQPSSRSKPTFQSESAEPSRKATESTVDPGDYTVKELREELKEVTDREELETALDREENGSNRRTAKEAIRRRMRALDETEE